MNRSPASKRGTSPGEVTGLRLVPVQQRLTHSASPCIMKENLREGFAVRTFEVRGGGSR